MAWLAVLTPALMLGMVLALGRYEELILTVAQRREAGGTPPGGRHRRGGPRPQRPHRHPAARPTALTAAAIRRDLALIYARHPDLYYARRRCHSITSPPAPGRIPALSPPELAAPPNSPTLPAPPDPSPPAAPDGDRSTTAAGSRHHPAA